MLESGETRIDWSFGVCPLNSERCHLYIILQSFLLNAEYREKEHKSKSMLLLSPKWQSYNNFDSWGKSSAKALCSQLKNWTNLYCVIEGLF